MIKQYTIGGAARLCISLAYTKLFFPGSRLIRLPFDIRNKRYIKLGTGFTTGRYCRLEAYPQAEDKRDKCLIIGDRVQINDAVHIAAAKSIVIGNDVLIASKVFISDINHGAYGKNDQHVNPEIRPSERPLSTAQVVIEDNVWLGEFVCVLPGVTIGRGAIIGAMSVVTKNIPPYTIAVGIPAKPIKRFNFISGIWETIQ
jgi:lipopolysaccharide O-acetyltransferase